MKKWGDRIWGCGYCGTMAYALSQKYGWKMALIWGKYEADGHDWEDYPHAVALLPDGKVADSVGVDTFENVLEYCVFDGDIIETGLREINKQELGAIYGFDLFDEEPMIQAYDFIARNEKNYLAHAMQSMV